MRFLTILAGAALVASSAPAVAVVTYKFTALNSSPYDNGAGREIFSGSFEVTLPSAITTDTVIPGASLTSCSYFGTISGPISCFREQEFRFGVRRDYLRVLFSTNGVGFFYFFDPAAATTAGTWNTQIFAGLQDGILVTSFDDGAVPEPASWAMLIVGFGLVGAIRRRQAHVTAA